MTNNLLVVALIFVATIISNALGVLYQRYLNQEAHFKATTISVVIAGLSLFIWKVCLTEEDITHSIPAIASYLAGDAVGVYAGMKLPVVKPLPHSNKS